VTLRVRFLAPIEGARNDRKGENPSGNAPPLVLRSPFWGRFLRVIETPEE